MLEQNLVIVNQLGLHARAAARLVKLASRFNAEVTLLRSDNGAIANAKSILSVLHLAAPAGTAVTISVEGADEAEALDATVNLFRSGFGEL